MENQYWYQFRIVEVARLETQWHKGNKNVLIPNSNGWSGQNLMQFNFGAQVTSRLNLGTKWNLASLKGINSQSMNLSKLSAETIPTAATTTSSPSTTSGTEVTLVQHREKVESFEKGTCVFYWKHITCYWRRR